MDIYYIAVTEQVNTLCLAGVTISVVQSNWPDLVVVQQ